MYLIIRLSILFLFLLLLPSFLIGQVISVNNRTESIALQDIAKVYADAEHKVNINRLLTQNSFDFQNIDHLNIGITYKNYWLDFSLKNTSNKDVDLLLVFGSIVNDSLFLYKVADGSVVEETTLGEALPFSAKVFPYQTPVFQIHLKPDEDGHYFLKSSGIGQPMNLTANLVNIERFYQSDVRKMFFLGLSYGILVLLLLFNVSFFFITKERIYLIFVGQLAASVLCLLYFDGFVHRYIFPKSGYWSNETIAVALCSVYLFFTFFFTNFFNLKDLAPFAHRVFGYVAYGTFGVMVVSFIHPWGFNFFIDFMIFITSLVAVLLFVSVLIMRRLGVRSYFFILLAIIGLIIFGSAFQLFMVGLLPDVFVTHNAMHLAMLFLSVFLAFGVNDKFRLTQEENRNFQEKLAETLGAYSQKLIFNIEAERHRLAIEIHDGLGQNLLTIRNTVLKGLKQKDIPSKIEDTFHTLLDITSDALEDTRAMSYNLRPPILNAMGLTAAIESLVEKMSISLAMDVILKMPETVDGVVAKDLEINIYRILQESFNNASKHAHASKINLTILRKTESLDIAFQDNGIGYDQNVRLNGQGILGIKERVALLKGILRITSDAATGTLLFITIPVLKPG